jgi:hypothetical protein
MPGSALPVICENLPANRKLQGLSDPKSGFGLSEPVPHDIAASGVAVLRHIEQADQ